MNLPNDDYLKAMNGQYPRRIPVSICILPAAWMRYREELDRLVAKHASLFPFATPAEIDAHIRDAVEKLGAPEGGLWLRGNIDQGVPLENIEAIFCALEKYREMFS